MKSETKRLAIVLNVVALCLFFATGGLLYAGAQDAAVIAFDITLVFILCGSAYWMIVYWRNKKDKGSGSS